MPSIIDATNLLFDNLPMQDVLLTLGLAVSISTVAAEIGLNEVIACSIGYVATTLIMTIFKWSYAEYPDILQTTDNSQLWDRGPIYQMTICFTSEVHTSKIRATSDRFIIISSFQSSETRLRYASEIEKQHTRIIPLKSDTEENIGLQLNDPAAAAQTAGCGLVRAKDPA